MIDEIGLRMLIAERRGLPRVHGNGFIQLDVAEGTRLHIWGHRDIPRQKNYTGVHDHTFSFNSKVLRGRVFQMPYTRCAVNFGQQYRIFTPVTRGMEDTVLNHTDLPPIRMAAAVAHVVNAGESYYMKAGAVHETVADMPAATLMTKRKDKRLDRPARVFVPDGQQPDNSFNRYAALSVDSMWRIIEDVMAGPL